MFSFTTTGSKLSTPNAAIFPSVQYFTTAFVFSMPFSETTKAVVKYCTEGNIAAFGVESFDPAVVKENLLNCSPNIAMKAIELLNTYGAERGPNGMPKFLPGINIIFGLGRETKKTYEFNMNALKKIY